MSIALMSRVWELDLKHGEQSVLMVLADHAKDDGTRCFPSVHRIAWKTGYEARQVRRLLKDLKALELIEAVAHESGGRGYATEFHIHIAKGVKKSPFIPPSKRRRDDVSDSGDTGAGQEGQGPRISEQERVTSEALKGDTAMSPQPSLTVLESSDESSGEPSEGPLFGPFGETFKILLEIPGAIPLNPNELEPCVKWLEGKGITPERAEETATSLAAKWGGKGWTYRHVWMTFRKWVVRPPLGEELRVEDIQQPDEPISRRPVGPIVRGDDGIWDGALKELANQTTRPAFETWLAGTLGIGFTTEGILVVAVPTEIVAGTLNERMYSLIAKAVETVNGGDELDIEFMVSEPE